MSVVAAAKQRIPESLKRAARRVYHRGSARECPICDSSVRAFLTHGNMRRTDARCPVCGLVERHRLTYLFLMRHTDLFGGPSSRRMLHIAPEVLFAELFSKAVGPGYLTADLLSEYVMEKMDITQIGYPEDTFDIVFCSHVLEHVPADRQAISEFHRVLKPGGWAILNVPVTADETIEDLSITDPAERLRLYGQHDHVRRYGPDYENRLVEAGFEVTRYTTSDIASAEEAARYGIDTNWAGDVYYCKKQSAA